MHWVKSLQIQSFFWSVFSCIWTEYRKIRARKNSVFGHFSRSGNWKLHFSKTIGVINSELSKVKWVICLCKLINKVRLIFCRSTLKLNKNIAYTVGWKKDLSVNLVSVLIIQKKTINLLFDTYHVTPASIRR